MDNNEIVRMRVQISRLLALASDARGRDDVTHAEELVERAMKLAQEVEAFEASQSKEPEK